MRARFSIEKQTPTMVWIADCNGPMSVTNDAEAVCQNLYASVGNKRIIYRDSMGDWDELLHKHGEFCGFAPARDLAIESNV